MKKLIFTTTFILLVFINFDKSYSQKPIGEDDRIIITVDSIERFKSYPENLKQKDTPFATYKYPSPSEGCDFVLIRITEVKKRDLNVDFKEWRISNTNVIDDKGGIHKVFQKNLGISIKFTIPDKNSGSLLLEMPKDAKPVQLKYSYEYREEPPESQEIKIGLIDIKL
jgi:hypothetical protein